VVRYGRLAHNVRHPTSGRRWPRSWTGSAGRTSSTGTRWFGWLAVALPRGGAGRTCPSRRCRRGADVPGLEDPRRVLDAGRALAPAGVGRAGSRGAGGAALRSHGGRAGAVRAGGEPRLGPGCEVACTRWVGEVPHVPGPGRWICCSRSRAPWQVDLVLFDTGSTYFERDTSRDAHGQPGPPDLPTVQVPRPTDPGVTVSRYRALVILITRKVGRKEPIPSARTGAGLAGRSRASTGRPSSSPAAACTSCGSDAASRH
jgi:hypothetical protein